MSNNAHIKKLFNQKSLLDIAIQVEKFLDSMNLYVYPGWFKGEVVDGPTLSRYWVNLKLKYDYKDMPDPKGAIVLSKVGVIVKYGKSTENIPVKVKAPDDYEPGTKRPRLKEFPVWLVSLQIPRRVIDEADLEDLDVLSDEVDIDDITDAADKGLEDEF